MRGNLYRLQCIVTFKKNKIVQDTRLDSNIHKKEKGTNVITDTQTMNNRNRTANRKATGGLKLVLRD